MEDNYLYYHASENIHKIGEVLQPRPHGLDWIEKTLGPITGKGFGSFMESQRDHSANPISRLNAIYMCSTNDFSCQVVSRYKHIYLVAPLTEPTPHDNVWLGVLQYRRIKDKSSKITHHASLDLKIQSRFADKKYGHFVESDEELADNYWKGKSTPTPCWEFLTDSLIMSPAL